MAYYWFSFGKPSSREAAHENLGMSFQSCFCVKPELIYEIEERVETLCCSHYKATMFVINANTNGGGPALKFRAKIEVVIGVILIEVTVV